MTAIDESPSIDALSPQAAGRGPAGNLAGALERFLGTVSERLNPILVKETRQSLKSRQFVVTFFLLLIAGWIWSLAGVALMGQEVLYGTRGAEVFWGYYCILAFPLLIIVPFGAFRSLAVEQEDRTYELLSITDLNPRQILSGKLGSAVVQMTVYLSAIAPCLAFTYMLRGIDFPTILFMVFYTVVGSLSLSVISLLAGTLTREKHWQVVVSVLLIIGLFWVFILYVTWFTSVVLFFAGLSFDEPVFWQGNAAFMTAVASFFLLVFYAAVGQITFASDNRSTRLRVIMVAQHVLFTGWIAWALVMQPEAEGAYTYMMILGLYWYVAGALTSGEWPQLSTRVKRQLPQTFLGRMLFTWFNPGPGTGYVFAVCGMLAGLVTVSLGIFLHQTVGWNGSSPWSGNEINSVLVVGTLTTAYVTIYLGIGLLLTRGFRRLFPSGLLLGALIQVSLAAAGIIAPLVIQSTSSRWSWDQYSLLQMPNPFWTLFHVVDRNALPVETPVLMTMLPLVALIVFLLNLPGVAKELRHVRIARPARVVEEDAQLMPVVVSPEPTRLDPWDE
jgi:hypothetical protein